MSASKKPRKLAGLTGCVVRVSELVVLKVLDKGLPWVFNFRHCCH